MISEVVCHDAYMLKMPYFGGGNLDLHEEWIYQMLQMTHVNESYMFYMYFPYCEIQKSLLKVFLYKWEAYKLNREESKLISLLLLLQLVHYL